MMNYYMYVVGGALGVVLEPPFYKFLDPALIQTDPITLLCSLARAGNNVEDKENFKNF